MNPNLLGRLTALVGLALSGRAVPALDRPDPYRRSQHGSRRPGKPGVPWKDRQPLAPIAPTVRMRSNGRKKVRA